MVDTSGKGPRRIATIAPSGSVPVQREGAEECSVEERLVTVLTQFSEMIRAGALTPKATGRVLLDAVVGDMRCVLVQQLAAVEVELSPREQQIARMVADGRTNQSIAAALEISVWTVSTHLRRIFAKLAVSSRAEMVARLRESEPGFD